MVLRRLVCSVLVWVGLSGSVLAAPDVVVSIMPIHSLVSQLMEGVAQPTLLLPPDQSPHHFQLKPSDAAHLEKADLVIWVGPDLEAFLEKPMTALAANAKIITLMNIPDLKLLDMNADHHHAHSSHSSKDPHIWLDPINAIKMIPAITHALIELDPEHASLYNDRAIELEAKLKQLDDDLKRELTPVQQQAFLVYHDGYQYFIDRYKLNGLGPITDHPHIPLSLNKIQKIRSKLATKQVVCVFSEPEINPNIMAQLVSDTPVRQGVLDPLGFDLKPGPAAYETMMRELGNNIAECLKKH